MLRKLFIYSLIFVVGYAYIKNASFNDSNNKLPKTENTASSSQSSTSEAKFNEQSLNSETPKPINSSLISETTSPNDTSLNSKIAKPLEPSTDFNPLAEENKKIFDSLPLDTRSPEFTSPNNKSAASPQPTLGAFEKKFVDIISKFATTENGIKVVDKLFSPLILNDEINKNPYSSLSEEVIQQGSGKIAYCGDLVTTNYLLKDEHGQTLKNTKQTSPEDIYIGFSPSNRGIDYSLIGMKEHGIKRRLLPRSQMKEMSDPSIFYALEIELVGVKSPPPPINPNQINMFDQTKATTLFKPFRCGDKVRIKYNIKNIQGKILYETNEFFTFKIGEQNIPFVLNLMTQGMFPASKRTAIVPYSAYTYSNGATSSKFNMLKKEELSIIEIEMAA